MKECLVCAKCFNDSSSYCSEDGNPLKRTLAGDVLLDGRYQLRRRLGQGGMGVVYKARHLFLKTTHAIKVILPDLVGSDSSDFLTRFRQEAMAAAAIRHHNIIAVTDYGVVNNSMPFLVMEYIQGKSLHDVLVKEGKLPPARALEIMEPIAAGVSAAHRRSIVHRDLKPLNIMIEDELPIQEAVKLLDFGLAKIKSGELLGSFVAAKTTGLMGSPFYMAPEQWSEEEPDKCADIYSLGIILYQMLAGDVPFKGPSIPSIMKKHLLEKPPHFAELGAVVPPEVEEVVRHTLEKEPSNRPPTVQAFINDLREAVNASNVTQKALRDHMANLLETLPRTMEDQLAGTISSDYDIELSLRQSNANALVEERRKREGQEQSRHDETEEEQRLRHEAENQARIEAEARRRQQEEDARRRAQEEEERRKREQEESERRAAEAASRRRAEEEAERKLAEEVARKRAEEAARKLAEEEAARKKAEEEEAARKLAEEEAARLAAEEEARKRAAKEQRRREEEAEAAQRAAVEAERKRVEEEAHARWLAELAAKERERKEEEERLEAEAKKKQEAERQRQREEEERRQREEEEEERRQLEEKAAARKRAEEEETARKLEEEEANRKRAKEEAERQRVAEEAERQRLAEEAERQRVAEAARRRAGEEARERAEAEARRLAEAKAARVRAETEARRKQQEEEERRKSEAENARLEEEAAQRRREAEAERAERQRQGSEERQQPSGEATGESIAPFVTQQAPQVDFFVTRTSTAPVLPDNSSSLATPAPVLPDNSSSLATPTLPSVEVERKESSRMVGIGIAAGVLVLLLSVGVAAIYYVTRPTQSDQSGQTPPGNQTTNTARSDASPTAGKTTPAQSRLVLIPGGVFQMGRNDLSKTSLDYNQFPAHYVSVKSFYLDKTEVTNAEYAEFVRATGHPAPEAAAAPYWTPWNGSQPPAGQEQWPVRNVSVADAVAFAAWRTKRDNLDYRLPTEEEWEYAARNEGESTLYPWGQKWVEQSANVDAALPMPVGSYANGATRAGALDMIGNVWEWTTSEASIYPGNNERDVKKGDKGQVIVRGGSYRSKASGGEPITSASRQWVPRETKHPTIGFRLVRDSPAAPLP